MRGVWKALNDPTRVRLLALLRESELSVSELQRITFLSQSLISAHLAVLRKVNLVRTRKQGKRIYYEPRTSLPKGLSAIVEAAVVMLREIPGAESDQQELRHVLNQRRQEAQNYFNRIAGKLGKAYCPGRTWSAVGPALAHMIGHRDVADLGAGEGWLTLLLAQRARQVIAVDNSPKMIEFGQGQLELNGIENVEFRLGGIEDPPIDEASVDLVVFSQALHHAEHPEVAIGRAVGLLRAGGSCVILDLLHHQNDQAREVFHDRWLGFTEADLRDWMEKAGLEKILVQILEADSREDGYTPILASGVKGAGGDPLG